MRLVAVGDMKIAFGVCRFRDALKRAGYVSAVAFVDLRMGIL
jgi:hypothetical protein